MENYGTIFSSNVTITSSNTVLISNKALQSGLDFCLNIKPFTNKKKTVITQSLFTQALINLQNSLHKPFSNRLRIKKNKLKM